MPFEIEVGPPGTTDEMSRIFHAAPNEFTLFCAFDCSPPISVLASRLELKMRKVGPRRAALSEEVFVPIPLGTPDTVINGVTLYGARYSTVGIRQIRFLHESPPRPDASKQEDPKTKWDIMNDLVGF